MHYVRALQGVFGKRPRHRMSAAVLYCLSVLAILATFATRFWLDPLVGHAGVFLGYVPAVVAISIIGGVGPALVAVGLSTALGIFDLRNHRVTDDIYFHVPLHIAVSLIIVITTERWRRLHFNLDLALQTARERLRAAQRSERRFRSTFEQAAVGMAHVGSDGTLLRVNERLSEILGYSRDELLTRKFQQLVDYDLTTTEQAHALRTGATSSFSAETSCVTKSGTEIAVSLTVSLVKEFEGQNAYYIVVLQDITARNAASAAIQQRTAELETLLDTAPVGIWFAYGREISDAVGNRYACELFGVGRGERERIADVQRMPLRNLRLFLGGAEIDKVGKRPLQRAGAGEQVINEHLEARLEDGRRIQLLANASPIRDAQGEIIGAVSVNVDITQLKQAEAALRDSEERFRVTVETVPNIVFMHRSDGFCEYVNPRYQELTGRTPSDAEGFGWRDDIHPADLNAVLTSWADAVQCEEQWECHYRIRALDGAFRWGVGQARPMWDAQGGVIRWMGVVSDVHHLVESAAELRVQKNHLDLALAAGRLGTWQYDFETEQVSGDDTFWGNFGLVPGPPRKAREVTRSIHRNDRQALRQALARCLLPEAPGFDIDLRILWPDGSTHWINLRGRPDRSDEKLIRLLGVSAEVTERREAEMALARAAHDKTLINVLSHRIGNLFPVILSIVRMAAPHYEDVVGYRQALLKRLRALEGAHILLARELNEAALIEELVRVELAAFEDGGQVVINGARVHLTGGTAESFSMIVHELATNSVKYGALSVPEGKVSVRWRRQNASRRLVFEWIESNGPPIRASSRRGYGSAIIGVTGPPLVGDTARVEFTSAGLSYTLTIPATNLLPHRNRHH